MDNRKILILRGIELLAKGLVTKTEINFDSLIKEHPVVIEKYLMDITDPQTLKIIIEYFHRHHPERFLNEKWKERLLSSFSKFDYDEVINFSTRGNYIKTWVDTDLIEIYFSILDAYKKEGFFTKTWEEIQNNFNLLIHRPYSTEIISHLAPKFIEEDQVRAVEFLHSTSFKDIFYDFRKYYYKSFIECGLLDKKIARRIRSESSEYTASFAISALLNNLFKYNDAKELLTQFTDIKHWDCQFLLASKAPSYMVPYMMAFESPGAKAMLEKRLKEIAEQKEQNNE